MDFFNACKKRQGELMRILQTMDDDPVWDGNEHAAERFRKSAKETISRYEEILHLLKGEQIGHA